MSSMTLLCFDAAPRPPRAPARTAPPRRLERSPFQRREPEPAGTVGSPNRDARARVPTPSVSTRRRAPARTPGEPRTRRRATTAAVSRRTPGKERTPGWSGPGVLVKRVGCGEGIRTPDLRVMSPTSCRCSTPRLRRLPSIARSVKERPAVGRALAAAAAATPERRRLHRVVQATAADEQAKDEHRARADGRRDERQPEVDVGHEAGAERGDDRPDRCPPRRTGPGRWSSGRSARIARRAGTARARRRRTRCPRRGPAR